MCGIFGSPTITASVRQMLPYLGIAMQTRGRDAWGCSNGETVLRYTGELVDSWDKAAPQIANWQSGIFHTRGASCGDRTKVENAHPFSYQKTDGSWVIGIHNGCLHNHTELNKTYSRDCEVDSMHIWRHLAEGQPWKDIEGWGNLAWYETREGIQHMNLARFNSDNLNVVQLEQGEWVFASEGLPIRVIAKMYGNPIKTIWKLDEFHHYWFAPDNSFAVILWRDKQRLPFPEPWKATLSSGPDGYGYGYCNPNWGRGKYRTSIRPPMEVLDSYCLKCGHTKISSKATVLCVSCFNEWVGDFVTSKRAAIGASN